MNFTTVSFFLLPYVYTSILLSLFHCELCSSFFLSHKEWQNIGVLLELSPQDLSIIKSHDISNLREVLILWLTHVDPLPSWGALADAVELFDHQITDGINHFKHS